MLNYLYSKWILNSKNVIVIVLMALINSIVITKLYNVYARTNEPFSVYESGIVVLNAGLFLFFITIVFVIIMSDYPSADSNLYFLILRCGRKKWFISQMLFSFLAIMTYIGVVFAFVLIRMAPLVFVANGWSLNISDYGKQMGLLQYIPFQLYNQMPPLQALVFSIVLLWAYLQMLLGFQMLGFSCGSKKIFSVIQMVILAVGIGMVFLDIQLKWYFPQAHSILCTHYQKYFKRYYFNPYLSLALLIIVGIAFHVLAYLKFMRTDVDRLKENEL